ncbi:MAG: PAS domain-containing protein, partial [Deltaproteobacteria bacterium]|nr:PAS domain-containing protein [Deltaproteobacteria bacterium]
NIRITHHGVQKLMDLRIKPMPHKKQQEPLVAVFIIETKREETETNLSVQSFDLSTEAEERLRDLEQELQFTRENLQATIEELETSNEELQATNEELLSSNEELQSTNEELQSTNEELFTVNAEYQSKIIELTELHNDVDNLLSATQIGNLLLDENLEVRRFSKKTTEIFKLLDADVGRPITHISHFLADCDPVRIIRDVQQSSRPAELEVQTHSGQWLLMRVVPYIIGPKTFSGTVISFVDISDFKRAEKSASSSQILAQMTIDSLLSNICVLDEQGVIMALNKSWRDFSQSNQADPSRVGVGVNYLDICSRSVGSDDESAHHFRDGIRAVMSGASDAFEMEYPCHSADQSRWFIGRVTPYIGSGAGLRKVVITHEDITLRNLSAEALRISEAKLRTLLKQCEGKECP